MMKLADYLIAHNLSAAEFAARIGVHRSTVSRWVDPVSPGGEVFRPSWEQLANIRRVTNGAVTANDFAEPVLAGDGGEAASSKRGCV